MFTGGSVRDSSEIESDGDVSPGEDTEVEKVRLLERPARVKRALNSAYSQIRSDTVHCEHIGRFSSHFLQT